MSPRTALFAFLAVATVVACADRSDDASGVGGSESNFTQEEVDGDPTLKALQARAVDVNQYEINVNDIAVPIPSAEDGAEVNGFATYGLDWFQNPAVTYPDNKDWDQGTDTGKKCQWAAVFRFQAIFTDPPPEAIAMRDMPNGQWDGNFWSWIDDHASTDSVQDPTRSYAWSRGLWKWIGASGKDGLCRLPTKTMVAKMMSACLEHAQAHEGNPQGCRMPAYDPAVEPSGPTQ